MKLAVLALATAATLGVAGLTIGCNDSSDALSLDEYFAEFEAIDADVDAQIEAAYADFPEDADDFSDDTNLPYFKDLIAVFPRVVSDLLDQLNDLEPPAEVEDAHNELIDAGEDLLVVFQNAADELGGAATMAEFGSLNDELDLTIAPASTRFDAACLAVVAIGEDNGVAVDVTCQDE
jgi:hypothetical protein